MKGARCPLCDLILKCTVRLLSMYTIETPVSILLPTLTFCEPFLFVSADLFNDFKAG